MNRFDDLLQRVSLLNAQLQPIEHHVGSQARMVLYRQLWCIVDQLNQELTLGLDNTALDLTARDERLVLHYFSGVGGSAEEITLIIDRCQRVEKHTKNLATGNVTTSGMLLNRNSFPTVGPSTAAVSAGRDTQRQRARDDPSQGL